MSALDTQREIPKAIPRVFLDGVMGARGGRRKMARTHDDGRTNHVERQGERVAFVCLGPASDAIMASPLKSPLRSPPAPPVSTEPASSAAQPAAAAAPPLPSAASASAASAALEAAIAAEAAIDQQERVLMERAAALERQVQEHKEQKEAIALARLQAEEQKKAEMALDNWQSELRKETDTAIERLNVQRQAQLARCQQFEAQLQANIDAMIQMQQQVRRRAVALDTSFDACVSRLSNAYADAVAKRRGQQAAGAARTVHATVATVRPDLTARVGR